jgi:hypothetical protein
MNTKITKKDLDNRFTYHPPKGDQAETYQKLRKTANTLANKINKSCPDSREKNIAITKLEEAIMWANASIARNE